MPGHDNSGSVAVDASHCFDDCLGGRQLISASLARGRESISRLLIFSNIGSVFIYTAVVVKVQFTYIIYEKWYSFGQRQSRIFPHVT